MKSSQQSDDSPASPKRPAALLARTMTDTTWRMFVPTIGLTVLGLVIDNHYPTKPWATIAGVVIGSTLAILLVRRQLAALREQ